MLTRALLTCEQVLPGDLSARDIALWRDMQAATPLFRSPLLSPDFVAAVAAVRSDVRIVIVRRGADVLGFLPVHIRPGRFARPVGAPFSDYSALITAPDPNVTIGEVLQAAGIDHYQAIGLVDPYGVFGAVPDGEPDESYGIDLAGEGPDSNANKKLLKNIRRLTRHAEEALGPIRIVAGDRNRDHFDAMIALKRRQTRETGLHDFLGAPWVQQMLNSLFDAPRDGLHGFMVTLMAGDTPLLYHFGPRLGDRAHPWISSYDSTYATFSPGQIFLHGLHDPLRDAGIGYYDLSTGAQAYKAIFSNASFPVRHVRAHSDAGPAQFGATAAKLAGSARKVLGPRVDDAFARLNRRLDQIAALELDTMSRVRGVAFAVSNASKRRRGSENG